MSQWQFYVEQLNLGRILRIRPKGHSMKPLIENNDQIEITPISLIKELKINDIVLCKVKGNFYVHKITAIQDQRYQISNNHGYVNGWTSKNQIFGKVTANYGQ